MAHYFYPEHAVTVEAENQAEADAKLLEMIEPKEVLPKTDTK